jgi:hypothetical protein
MKHTIFYVATNLKNTLSVREKRRKQIMEDHNTLFVFTYVEKQNTIFENYLQICIFINKSLSYYKQKIEVYILRSDDSEYLHSGNFSGF